MESYPFWSWPSSQLRHCRCLSGCNEGGSDFQCLFVSGPYREVVTFNHFLEAAAEKEVQGKARLHDFIENLLQRVELAEKQLEYYQSQQASGFSRDTTEHVVSPAQPASSPSPAGMNLDRARTEEKGAV